MLNRVQETARMGLAMVILAAAAQSAVAQLYINEIFFNPGGQANDLRDEYIELRGTPGMSLANHYLVFLENELDSAGLGDAGIIENIFDLGAYSLGSNGFLVLRQKDSRYQNIAPGTANIINTGSGVGFGNGPASSIGASDDHTNENEGTLSNSGATAMLIHNHGGLVPTLGFDMDQGKDGLDSREGSLQQPLDDWNVKWSVLDSVGYFAEPQHSEYGRLYASVNFVPFDADFPFGSGWEPNVEPGAEFEMLPFELEHLARWGNSTGQTVADWHATNLTDNFGSGYINNTFLLRQSCIDGTGCHPANDGNHSTPAPQPESGVESNKNVPYGTILTGDLGAPNFLIGDYNKDGVVDAADYTVWRNTLGQTGSEFVLGPPPMPLIHNHPKADGNHDFVVDEADYAIWKAYYGAPFNSPGPGAGAAGLAAVPEPASFLLAALAMAFVAIRQRQR